MKKAAESHIDLLHNLISKMTQYSKMEDDSDYIPRSVTKLINFDFRVTKSIENNPEFLVIKADTDTLIQEFKLGLKRKVMEKLKLEIRILRNELFEHLCINLHLVIQAFLISEQLKTDPHKTISTLLRLHFVELFEHTDLELNELYEKYKTARTN